MSATCTVSRPWWTRRKRNSGPSRHIRRARWSRFNVCLTTISWRSTASSTPRCESDDDWPSLDPAAMSVFATKRIFRLIDTMSAFDPQQTLAKPLFQSRADCRLLGMDAIAQAEFIHSQFPKHVGIADAALRPSDDFLGDKSRRWIIRNFQMQRIAGFDESSG